MDYKEGKMLKEYIKEIKIGNLKLKSNDGYSI